MNIILELPTPCAGSTDWDTPLAGATDRDVIRALNAIARCGTCPYSGRCPVTDPIGIIADGTPHDDKQRPMPHCRTCGGWVLGADARTKYCRACVDQPRVAVAA